MNKIFTVHADDETVITFGKYVGKRLGDIPDNYIRWLHDHSDFCKQHKHEDNVNGAIARYIILACK